MLKAPVHSVETFGTVDGPGIRYVVFFQGCKLRCQYCHNPDLWDEKGGSMMSVEDIITDFQKYLDFYKPSGGGITVTGGEPLLHMEFVTELFRRCKELGINTAVDTSAAIIDCDEAFDRLIELTDLFLLDIKHMDEKTHIKLTGASNRKTLQAAAYLAKKAIPVWIRHVLVSGFTLNEESANKLAEFILGLGNVDKVELLPFHQMGAYKWQSLGRKYPLKDIETPSKKDLDKIKNIFSRKKIPFTCVN